jgi:hypothetical protein
MGEKRMVRKGFGNRKTRKKKREVNGGCLNLCLFCYLFCSFFHLGLTSETKTSTKKIKSVSTLFFVSRDSNFFFAIVLCLHVVLEKEIECRKRKHKRRE